MLPIYYQLHYLDYCHFSVHDPLHCHVHAPLHLFCLAFDDWTASYPILASHHRFSHRSQRCIGRCISHICQQVALFQGTECTRRVKVLCCLSC